MDMILNVISLAILNDANCSSDATKYNEHYIMLYLQLSIPDT